MNVNYSIFATERGHTISPVSPLFVSNHTH